MLNVYRGSVSEAANQRLRHADRPHDGRPGRPGTRSGEKGVKVSIIVSEVEAVGGFVGSSFCDPLLNAGILVSMFGYMLFMQPWLALVAPLIFMPAAPVHPLPAERDQPAHQRRIQKLRKLSADIVDEARRTRCASARSGRSGAASRTSIA